MNRTDLSMPLCSAACPVLQHACPAALYLTVLLSSQSLLQYISALQYNFYNTVLCDAFLNLS